MDKSKLLKVSLLVWLLPACTLNKASDAKLPAALAFSTCGTLAVSTNLTPEVLGIYTAGIHNYIQDNCAECHDQGTGPQFASENPSESHSNIVSFGFVNFAGIDDPSLTPLLSRAIDANHGPDCTACGPDQESIVSAHLVSWRDSLVSAGLLSSTGECVEGDVLAARTNTTLKDIGLVPTSSEFPEPPYDVKTLTFDLDTDLDGGSLGSGGATLSIDFTKGPDGLVYYFLDLRVSTQDKALKISDIWIHLNDFKSDPNETYTLVDLVVPAGETDFSLSTQGGLLVIKDEGTDQLGLSFGEISVQ